MEDLNGVGGGAAAFSTLVKRPVHMLQSTTHEEHHDTLYEM
jgi:hypothetical protein